MIRFVSKHNIKTPQDIRNAMAECQAKVNDLKETRALLYNRIRRPKETDTVDKLKEARDSLTKEISAARNELKTASKLVDLLTRMEKEVDEELELERNGIAPPEPSTIDEISRYINSGHYDPDWHYPPQGEPKERKPSGWRR